MVSKEELEDILHDEEVEARWKSIDQKKLRKAEKEREWYLNYTKKEYHPIAYQVKRELDEWEGKEPLFHEFERIKDSATHRAYVQTTIWTAIGLVLVWALLL